MYETRCDGSTPQPQASWDSYWLWQYSDGSSGPGPHGCPGISGDVDTNSWPGTDAQLQAQWTGAGPGPTPSPTPTTATVSIDIKTTGDVKVTVNGQEMS